MASRRAAAPFFAALLAASPGAQSAVADAVAGFAPHDLDGDGRAEVRALECWGEVGDTGPLVVVLVERRLVSSAPADAASPFVLRVRRLADDIAHEGHRVLTLVAEVHDGEPHQDGRTVLALRRLLQRCHAAMPMSAAVLVGHFPDALLVRTCNWRRREELTLPGPDGAAIPITATKTNVRCVPEYVAHRCDLVLADLDGLWEQVYVAGPTALPSVTVVFGDDVPDRGGACIARNFAALDVVDVFHVRDGAAVAATDSFAVSLDADDRDHECSAADRQLGNPLARPEISVSRLDARGVALLPETRAFDVAGRPQAVRAPAVRWQHDAALELQLLGEYLDRNHSFRTQALPAGQRKPASIAHELGSGMRDLLPAQPAWREFEEKGYDVHERADLVQLLRWLQRPAVLRTLRAHSDGTHAAFAATDVAALSRAAGAAPWSWQAQGDLFVPTWAGHHGGRADFHFYRTLWQQRLLPDHPYLLIHTGCEAASPPGAVELAYDAADYGRRAHAESILFFTPCLSMVARAKVFYDDPTGFSAALGEGATFGEAWRRYSQHESAASEWGKVGGDIGRKRSYFWSILGDCTLRLPD